MKYLLVKVVMIMDDNKLTLVFGETTINKISERNDIQRRIDDLYDESNALILKANKSFDVKLSLSDIIVSASAGVICGSVSGCFKSFVPKHGPLKHKHSSTRCGIDYQVNKPTGYRGSVQGSHRQIGPGHDIGRIKEAIDLMSGKTSDFPQWGSTIVKNMGAPLHTGNMSVEQFIKMGGFKIPDDPKRELFNHLLIDFFTKTSLPLPFTSYIADYNEFFAKIMLGMFDEGLNLKNLVGNSFSMAIVKMILDIYVLLFVVASNLDIYNQFKHAESSKTLFNILTLWKEAYNEYKKSNEYNVMQMISHGSLFTLDSTITIASKNYTGLLSLNYPALVSLANHSLMYVTSSMKKYSNYLKEIKNVNLAIEETNYKWFEDYKKDFTQLINNDGFSAALSTEIIAENHDLLMERFKESNDKRDSIFMEISEWDLDG